MLLAENHGKRLPEAETNEDWLTSAVFGHLRLIPPSVFWERLFCHALTAGKIRESLWAKLEVHHIYLSKYTALHVDFWRNCAEFGEPDLLLRFSGQGVDPIVVLVEVKLDSQKSSVGKDDQLKKYLEWLDRGSSKEAYQDAKHRVLVYLTRAFSEKDLEESIAECHWTVDARDRIFGLEWSQVLETARNEAAAAKRSGLALTAMLLGEVADFLASRGFETFKGFRTNFYLPSLNGSFYQTNYFLLDKELANAAFLTKGRFYGQ